MIHVEGLTKRYGEKVLFEDVSWHVKKRDRIGLSGPNGSGKTTLLRMLAGLEEPDAGSIRMASDTTIGYLPQDGVVHHGRTVYDEVVLAFQELLELKQEQHQIEDRLAETTHDDGGDHEQLLERYAEVTDRFKHLGGYEIDAQVADVLKGLGFSLADQQRKTEEFSGGWQMRIALAKLLLARPNLLLMDEPTNHLDLPARNWLEEYLESYPGSVVLVSHDRYFLDATMKRITEVGLRTLTDYHGNYSTFLTTREERMERLRQQKRDQDEEVERMQAFINRFRYQATKAAQVQSRIKMLEKIVPIEIPPERKRVHFSFPPCAKSGRTVLDLRNVFKAYGARQVFDGISVHIERGDRIALIGPNGVGKSTMMRILSGVEAPDRGTRTEGHQLVMQYFAQDEATRLDPTRTVYQTLAGDAPIHMVPHIRNILGGFLFSGDDIDKPVRVLSGGERTRLAVARMLLRPSNTLLLDEPTNHLDLDSKDVLLEALEDFGGTLIFVSHDRYFVDKLATKVIEIGDGQALLYPGNYEEWLWSKKQREQLVETPAAPQRRPEPQRRGQTPVSAAGQRGQTPGARGQTPKPASTPATSERGQTPVAAAPERYEDKKRRDADARRQKKAADGLRRRIEELEARIADRENAIKEIELSMSTPGFYDNREAAQPVIDRHQTLMWEVGDLMNQWEALQSEL
jgi:ATP-binding cassette, subfamily F, member 3